MVDKIASDYADRVVEEKASTYATEFVEKKAHEYALSVADGDRGKYQEAYDAAMARATDTSYHNAWDSAYESAIARATAPGDWENAWETAYNAAYQRATAEGDWENAYETAYNYAKATGNRQKARGTMPMKRPTTRHWPQLLPELPARNWQKSIGCAIRNDWAGDRLSRLTA